MRSECNYLLASGEKCHAPAVIGSSLCRHHHPRKRAENQAPFSLPPISDRSSLLAAISEVVYAVSERRIKRSDAGTLLFGLQLASTVMTDVEREVGRALASGESYIFDESFGAESSCDPPQEPLPEDHVAMKSVEALLRNMQAASLEPAFDRCQSECFAPSGKLRSGTLPSVPRAPR